MKRGLVAITAFYIIFFFLEAVVVPGEGRYVFLIYLIVINVIYFYIYSVCFLFI